MIDCILQYGWAIGLYGAFWAVFGVIVGRITRPS